MTSSPNLFGVFAIDTIDNKKPRHRWRGFSFSRAERAAWAAAISRHFIAEHRPAGRIQQERI